MKITGAVLVYLCCTVRDKRCDAGLKVMIVNWGRVLWFLTFLTLCTISKSSEMRNWWTRSIKKESSWLHHFAFLANLLIPLFKPILHSSWFLCLSTYSKKSSDGFLTFCNFSINDSTGI